MDRCIFMTKDISVFPHSGSRQNVSILLNRFFYQNVLDLQTKTDVNSYQAHSFLKLYSADTVYLWVCFNVHSCLQKSTYSPITDPPYVVRATNTLRTNHTLSQRLSSPRPAPSCRASPPSRSPSPFSTWVGHILHPAQAGADSSHL